MALSADFNLIALKDKYDYICHYVRLDLYNCHLMTYSPMASHAVGFMCEWNVFHRK
jgi:hypothetical protein